MKLRGCLALAALTIFLVGTGAAVAGTVEQDYQKARSTYRQLLQSVKHQQHRDRWHKAITLLQGVTEDYPKEGRAADALYLTGQAYLGMYRVSRLGADARRAVACFDALAEGYPESSLADDGLLAAGDIFEHHLHDLPEAYRRFAAIGERFSHGDQAAAAALRQQALSIFAPLAESKTPATAPAPEKEALLGGIRFWSNPGYTRVVLDLSREVSFKANSLGADAKDGSGPRLYLDLAATVPAPDLADTKPVGDRLLRQIRTGRPEAGTVRVVLDLVSFKDYKVFALHDPFRIVIDIAGERIPELIAPRVELRAAPVPAPLATPAPVAVAPTLANTPDNIGKILDQAPVEAPLQLNLPSSGSDGRLRRIVVDAGHGGKDPGAIGPSGVYEKDVTLAMARVLAKRLEQELGCQVILTRDRDVYLPLEERTGIANEVGADLFISIHANANNNAAAYGTETFYLNFSKNEQAAAVAARENGTSLKQVGDLELILFDLMAHSKIAESSRLASDIQKSLIVGLSKSYSRVRDLGVRQGPFYVLLGATMPSVLVETGFLSNKSEESRLADPKFQARAADGILQGIRTYATSLKLLAER